MINDSFLEENKQETFTIKHANGKLRMNLGTTITAFRNFSSLFFAPSAPFFRLRVTKCKKKRKREREKKNGEESSSRRARAGSLACSRVKPTRRWLMTLRCNDRLCTRERGAGLGSTGRHGRERKRVRVERNHGRVEGGEASETDGRRNGRSSSLSSILQELKGRLRATATPAIKMGAD